MKHPVAIVGIECIYPDAPDLARYWANIRRGHDAIQEVPADHWATEDYLRESPSPDFTYTQRGGFIPKIDFDPLEFGIVPENLEATDSTQLLGMWVAKRALADAGFDTKQASDERVSVVLGITGTLPLVIPLGARLGHPIWRRALREAGVEAQQAEDVVTRISESYVPWKENSFPGLLGNVVAGRIANRLDLKGTNCVVDAACASSLSAAHLAAMELETGRADLVVTGGLDTFNDIFMYMCFSQTPALSPTGEIRPFDAAGDGTLLGEGLGILVLKRLEDAERDGDRIYALLRSVGSSSDGSGQAIYAPSAKGQMRALRRAYELGEISPDTIELVETHGTGTRVGDAIEASALTEVYREARAEGTWCALGSVKSQIGHTKAAAGAAGLIKAALALHHRVLPPTIKVEQPLPVLQPGETPFYLNREARPWLPRATHPRRAGVSAFGFGGSNFHCVLEEYPASYPGIDWSDVPQPVTISATTREALIEGLQAWSALEGWPARRVAASQLRASFDASAALRLTFVSSAEFEPKLSQVIQRLRAEAGSAEPDSAAWSTPDGVSFASGAQAGGVALLFPGQGAQYAGMLRDLACAFPQLQASLAAFDESFATARQAGGPGASADEARLSDLIYPHSLYDDAAVDQAAARLRATDVAQPALGAVSLGALEILRHFGLQADALAGHSYGELVALHAAGVYDAAALRRLSILRGQLMASLSAGAAETASGTASVTRRGTMLAVRCGLEKLEALVGEAGLELVVANRNTPLQNVLSGSLEAIEAVATLLAEKKISCTRLEVGAAFHSPLVASAERPLAEALAGEAIQAPAIPVFANSTAEPYPAEGDALRAQLASQLARPVEFCASIQAMYAAGVRTFVELGPGARLGGMVRRILKGADGLSLLALDSSGGRRDGLEDLARLLAGLAALGHPLELGRWDPDAPAPEAKARKRFTVPIGGANYVSPRAPRPPSPPRAMPAEVSLAAEVGPVEAAGTLVPVPSAELQAAQLEALDANLQALLQMQTQTAELHRLFLEGQEAAQASFRELIALRPGAAPESATRVAPGEVAPSATRVAPGEAPGEVAQNGTLRGDLVGSGELSGAPPAAVTELSAALLAVVAERTGYPLEVLELGMDLDTDLGIDSIKRVEILSALQERLPGLEAPKPEELGKLHTLAEIVSSMKPAAAGTPTAGAPTGAPTTRVAPSKVAVNGALRGDLAGSGAVSAVQPAAGAAQAELSAALLAVVAERTGYPLEVLELEMDLDTDLGIDSIKRVEILSALQERLPGLQAPTPEALGKLHTLAEIVSSMTPAAAGTPTAGAPTGAPTTRVAPSELAQNGTLRGDFAGSGVVSAAQPASAAQAEADGELSAALLAVVAERTGYPLEVLELEMDLDTDLGIDSIKRVEILSALQERLPGLQAPTPEALGKLHTLAEIVSSMQPAAGAPTTRLAPGEAAPGEAAPGEVVQKGAPTTRVAPSEAAGVGAALQRSAVVLAELPAATAARLELAPASELLLVDGGADALGEQLEAAFTAQGLKPRRVPWEGALAALQCSLPEQLSGLILLPPSGSAAQPPEELAILQQGLALVQACQPSLVTAANAARAAQQTPGHSGGALLASISRLDGQLGMSGLGQAGALAGASLAGLIKTAALEWPAIACRALDLDPAEASSNAFTSATLEALLRAGPVERALKFTQGTAALSTLAVQPEPLAPGGVTLDSNDLVLISGGARGVTAQAGLAIAAQTGAKLLLLGRSPAPTEEPGPMAQLHSEAELKRALIGQEQGKASLKEIEAQYRSLIRNREMLHNLEAMRQAGATVVYRQVDVRDAAALRKLLDQLAPELGWPTVVVHGAGVLADAKIKQKTAQELQQVWSTKVGGWQALRAALGDTPLKALAFFSSTTARLGRVGQADYAVANEALNKLAHLEQRARPKTRVASIGWGPWDGGMVTPSLKLLFAEEGVPLIPLQAGGQHLLDELQAAPTCAVESVVLGAQGPELGPKSKASKPKQPQAEPLSATPLLNGKETRTGAAPRAATEVSKVPMQRAFSLQLDCTQAPVLQDHFIGGQAVLPFALAAEWLAQAALHEQPGLCFQGFEQLRLLRGVRLMDNETANLQLSYGAAQPATGAESGRGLLRLACSLERVETGTRRPVASATVLLAPAPASLGALSLDHAPLAVAELPFPFAPEALYQQLFHGPAMQSVEKITAFSKAGLTAQLHRAPPASEWLKNPLRSSWVTDPLALDAAFQLGILWSLATRAEGCLPAFVGRYLQQVSRFPEQLQLQAQLRSLKAQTLCMDFEWRALDGSLLAQLQGAEMTLDAALPAAFANRGRGLSSLPTLRSAGAR